MEISNVNKFNLSIQTFNKQHLSISCVLPQQRFILKEHSKFRLILECILLVCREVCFLCLTSGNDSCCCLFLKVVSLVLIFLNLPFCPYLQPLFTPPTHSCMSVLSIHLHLPIKCPQTFPLAQASWLPHIPAHLFSLICLSNVSNYLYGILLELYIRFYCVIFLFVFRLMTCFLFCLFFSLPAYRNE